MAEFERFRQWIQRVAGIHLASHKRALVMGRLAARLRARSIATYDEYMELVLAEPGEHDLALDLLTTNETHFFREAKHFDLLKSLALERTERGRPFRVWSAACSTGEEPYSIAMTLADTLQASNWEVLASDISGRTLARAQTGHYVMPRARSIPQEYLRAYCLKGTRSQAETFLIDPSLRQRVRFERIKLNEPLPDIGLFDVVFLRNVMIYFNATTKSEVVARVARCIRPGGRLLIGHSESLNGVTNAVRGIRPSVYAKD